MAVFVVQLARLLDFAEAVADDLQPPGLRREAGLDEGSPLSVCGCGLPRLTSRNSSGLVRNGRSSGGAAIVDTPWFQTLLHQPRVAPIDVILHVAAFAEIDFQSQLLDTRPPRRRRPAAVLRRQFRPLMPRSSTLPSARTRTRTLPFLARFVIEADQGFKAAIVTGEVVGHAAAAVQAEPLS